MLRTMPNHLRIKARCYNLIVYFISCNFPPTPPHHHHTTHPDTHAPGHAPTYAPSGLPVTKSPIRPPPDMYAFGLHDTAANTFFGSQRSVFVDPQIFSKSNLTFQVYQTAMENSSNKLITVYEIKPEVDEDGNGLGGRDVLVEIVSSPGKKQWI